MGSPLGLSQSPLSSALPEHSLLHASGKSEELRQMQAPKGTKVLQAGGGGPQVNPSLPPRGGGGPPLHQSPPLQGGPGAQDTCFTSTKLQILTPKELRARRRPRGHGTGRARRWRNRSGNATSGQRTACARTSGRYAGGRSAAGYGVRHAAALDAFCSKRRAFDEPASNACNAPRCAGYGGRYSR